MRLYELFESDGATTSALMASVVFPMTPGTTMGAARAAVDPKGYGPNKKGELKRVKKKIKVGTGVYDHRG